MIYPVTFPNPANSETTIEWSPCYEDADGVTALNQLEDAPEGAEIFWTIYCRDNSTGIIEAVCDRTRRDALLTTLENLFRRNGLEPPSPDEEAEAQLLIQHNEVTLYRCVTEGGVLSEHWVATEPHTDASSDRAFDIRDCPCINRSLLPEYRKLYGDDDVLCLLAYNIDIGNITEDGFNTLEEES